MFAGQSDRKLSPPVYMRTDSKRHEVVGNGWVTKSCLIRCWLQTDCVLVLIFSAHVRGIGQTFTINDHLANKCHLSKKKKSTVIYCMVPVIERYQLSSSKIREKISHKYWVVLYGCMVSARRLTSSQCTTQSARQFCTIFTEFLCKTVAYTSDFVKKMALIGATVCLNQQRKFSSFGRSSESEKHPTTCASVHGGGPFCQLCPILVSC